MLVVDLESEEKVVQLRRWLRHQKDRQAWGCL